LWLTFDKQPNPLLYFFSHFQSKRLFSADHPHPVKKASPSRTKNLTPQTLNLEEAETPRDIVLTTPDNS
jgi:hypothetical protein